MQMFSRGLCLFFLLLLLLQSTGAADRLRVVAFNAEWFPGRVPQPAPTQQARHVAGVQRVLHALDADLLLLQEVVHPDALALALAVQPDAVLYTVSAFTNNPHQLAIAGRLPLAAAETHPWVMPAVDPALVPPRGIAFAAVTLPDESLLLVFTLHLKSNYRGEDYDERRNVRMREDSITLFLKQVEAMERRFAGQPVRGVLLGGDMNTLYPTSFLRGERTVDRLKGGGFEHLGSHGLDHFWGKGIDDYVFSAFDAYAASDHAPIVLDITLDAGQTMPRRPLVPLEQAVTLVGNMRSDINRASRSELMSLPRIGPVLAQRIIDGRPFSSIDEMVDICGIGAGTLAHISPYIEVMRELDEM